MNEIRCPNCKVKLVHLNDKYFPFCSERCKTTDLGQWAAQKYSTASVDTEEVEDSSSHQKDPK